MNDLSKKIIIRSAYGKLERVLIQPAKNPKTKTYPSCVRPVDSAGNMILSEEDRKGNNILIPENQFIEVGDGTTFDLSNPYENALWEAIKHCRQISPERFAKNEKGEYIIDGDSLRYGTAFLYIYEQTEEIRKELNHKKNVHKAIKLAISNNYKDNEKVARILGCSTFGMSNDELEIWLISQSEQNPNRILDLYSSDDIRYRILFLDAIEKGYIISASGLYKYDGIIIGSTEDSVIEWLKRPENEQTVNGLFDLIHPELAKTKKSKIEKDMIEEIGNSDETIISNKRKTK